MSEVEAEQITIHWSCAYHIDNEAHTIEPVVDSDELNEYVAFHVRALRGSRRTAPYRARSESTEVVSLMRKQVVDTLAGDFDSSLESCRGQINDRFLEKESAAQRKIARLNTTIKSGCLIHAVVTSGHTPFYLIAKLDWSEYLERSTMSKSSGISIDDKVLGRSCLVGFTREGGGAWHTAGIDVSLDSAEVKYFVNEFLEIDPLFSDEKSTKAMASSVVGLIDRTFKKSYPQTRLELKNAFLCRMRAEELVDYEKIVDEVFFRYFSSPACPVGDTAVSQRFLDRMSELPDGRFARQFTLVPKAIGKRIVKTQYKLLDHVDLVVWEAAGERVFESIVSGSEVDGRSFIKVYTQDREAIGAFPPARYLIDSDGDEGKPVA